jgi:hypothetical protein
MATKTGYMLTTGTTRDTSSLRNEYSNMITDTARSNPETTTTINCQKLKPAGKGKIKAISRAESNTIGLTTSKYALVLGILLEMRWLSNIFTKPIPAALNMAILIQAASIGFTSQNILIQFTLLPVLIETLTTRLAVGRLVRV